MNIILKIIMGFVLLMALFTLFMACLLAYWCIGDAILQGGGIKAGWAVASVGCVIVVTGAMIATASKAAEVLSSNPFP